MLNTNQYKSQTLMLNPLMKLKLLEILMLYGLLARNHTYWWVGDIEINWINSYFIDYLI